MMKKVYIYERNKLIVARKIDNLAFNTNWFLWVFLGPIYLAIVFLINDIPLFFRSAYYKSYSKV